MTKFVVVLLAAAAAVTVGSQLLAGVEQIGNRVWTTSNGVTVICRGRQRSSDRPSLTAELQLSAVLDSVCRYLESRASKVISTVADPDSNQETDQDIIADIYQSVRYDDQEQ